MKETEIKAKELVEQFRVAVNCSTDILKIKETKDAIQCAIICVDEILKAHPIIPLKFMFESEALDEASLFWQEVLTHLKEML